MCDENLIQKAKSVNKALKKAIKEGRYLLEVTAYDKKMWLFKENIFQDSWKVLLLSAPLMTIFCFAETAYRHAKHHLALLATFGLLYGIMGCGGIIYFCVHARAVGRYYKTLDFFSRNNSKKGIFTKIWHWWLT